MSIKYVVSIFVMILMMIGTDSSEVSALALTISPGGQLTGATDVEVNSVLYDVTFTDGTCSALFTGCNDPTDFLFPSASQATGAGNALHAQVLVDGPGGLFNTFSSLTAGCEDPVHCFIFTPYSFTVAPVVQVEIQFVTIGGGGILHTSLGINASLAGVSGDRITWAVWTEAPGVAPPTSPPPSPVPEPATVVLLGTGLAGLIFSHRRKKSQSVRH